MRSDQSKMLVVADLRVTGLNVVLGEGLQSSAPFWFESVRKRDPWKIKVSGWEENNSLQREKVTADSSPWKNGFYGFGILFTDTFWLKNLTALNKVSHKRSLIEFGIRPSGLPLQQIFILKILSCSLVIKNRNDTKIEINCSSSWGAVILVVMLGSALRSGG